MAPYFHSRYTSEILKEPPMLLGDIARLMFQAVHRKKLAVTSGKFGAKVAATDSIFKKMDILRDKVGRKYVKCMVKLGEFTHKTKDLPLVV